MGTTMNKPWYNINETAEALKKDRVTISRWIKILGLETKKFATKRGAYIRAEDVEKLRKFAEEPWLLEE